MKNISVYALTIVGIFTVVVLVNGQLTPQQRNGAYVPGAQLDDRSVTVMVESIHDGLIFGWLAQRYVYGEVFDKYVAVTNYPEIGTVTVDTRISFKGKKIGVLNQGDHRPLDLLSVWPPPPAPTPPQKPLTAEQVQAKKLETEQKHKLAEAKDFEFWALRATNDDTMAQVRIADFYLTGHGTETNLVLARMWLIRAAVNKNAEASNKLQTISMP